jgi:phosphatidylserine/phosphatidylglycerophosphate/cardiolipin synthase-like enzyme
MNGSLADVATVDLELLLRAITDRSLSFPLGRASLAARGLGDLAGPLGPLFACPADVTGFVVDAILAERRRNQRPPAELVWTGPEVVGGIGRSTAVVVGQLFAQAERDVVICGYTFDRGENIFEPLHRTMCDRDVNVTIFVHIDRVTHPGLETERHVRRFVMRFLSNNWPFGPPYPTLYYDPHTVDRNALASLHARCVVIDERIALVTSANFTDRGQARNVEVGAVLHDRRFAEALTGHLRRLCRDEGFVQAPLTSAADG